MTLLRRSLLISMVAALLALNNGTSRADDKKPSRYQWITRFALTGDHMYLIGDLPGSDKHLTVTLLIDTGSDVNYINATTAAKAGLLIKTSSESVKSRVPDGKPWQYVVVPSIVSDQLNLSEQVFFLLPANKLPGFAASAKEETFVDGILGAQTLTLGAMMLDYDHDWMTLWYPGDLSQADQDAQGFQTVYTVPLSPIDDHSGRWVAQATVTNGNATTTTALMIDTGNEASDRSRAAGYLPEGRPESRLGKVSAPERAEESKTGDGASTRELHPRRLTLRPFLRRWPPSSS